MTDDTEGSTPYASAAPLYWAAGWRGLLPVPYGQKAPVPVGYTGSAGAFPSYPDVQAWSDERGDSNIVLRLPPDVLGIDVDAYAGKTGGEVFAQLEAELGELPPTWRVTSRDDGTSGIRLYRIPEGLRWPGILGPGIETVRFEHRYAVTWPSRHPNGGTYRWIYANGTGAGLSLDPQIPKVDNLPRLPETWIYKFTGYEKAATQERLDLDVAEAHAWLSARNGTGTCERMREARTEALATFGSSSRHEWGLALTNRVVWLAGEGHFGVVKVLEEAGERFVKDVSGDRSDARAEWDRMVVGATKMAAASFTAPISLKDACYGVLAATQPKEKRPSPKQSSSHSGSNSTPTTTPSSTPAPPATAAATSTAGTTTPRSAPLATVKGLLAAEPATASAASSSPTTDMASSPAPTATDTAGELDLSEYEEDLRPLIELEVARLTARRIAQRIVDPGDLDLLIEDKVRQLLVQEQARRDYQKAAEGAQTAPQPMSLGELLELPDSESLSRVEGLWPVGGRIVLAAVAKAGKSTLVTNLVKALVDDTLFLGKFAVTPPAGTVVVIDNELDPRQIRANYERQGIQNVGQVGFIPLRGNVGTFDITDQVIRAEWAEKIKSMNASIVIFDCLRPLIDALGLNENTDAGRILVAFDALLKDAGVEEGMIVHHMGHSGERSRGDTRIRDWPDAEWKLLKEKDAKGESKDDAPRFFSAFGRDVNVPEGQVEFDAPTNGLRLTGGTRGQAKSQPVKDELLGTLGRTGGGITQNGLADAMNEHGYSRESTRHALKGLIADGLVKVEPGPNRSSLHYLSDPAGQTTKQLLAA